MDSLRLDWKLRERKVIPRLSPIREKPRLRCKLHRNCVAGDFVIKTHSVCCCFSLFHFYCIKKFSYCIFFSSLTQQKHNQSYSSERNWAAFFFPPELCQAVPAVGEKAVAGLGEPMPLLTAKSSEGSAAGSGSQQSARGRGRQRTFWQLYIAQTVE